MGSNMCLYSQDRIHIELFRIARQSTVILLIKCEDNSQPEGDNYGLLSKLALKSPPVETVSLHLD
jgi:hypothetical protein